MVPLNPRLTPAESRFILEHSGARAARARRRARRRGRRRRRRPRPASCSASAAPSSARTYEADARGTPTPATRGPPSTSSTRSASPTRPARPAAPRACVISHRSRALTFYLSALEWGLGPGRTSAAVAPMYHGAGFAFGYAPVFCGGTVTMLRTWDPEEFLALLRARPGAVDVPGADARADAARARRGRRRQARPVRAGHPLLQRRRAAVAAQAVGDGGVPAVRHPRALRLDRGRDHHQPAPGRPAHASPARSATPGSSPSCASSTTRATRCRPASPASCSAARRSS